MDPHQHDDPRHDIHRGGPPGPHDPTPGMDDETTEGTAEATDPVPADPVPAERMAALPARVDVVVVGAGLAGLTAAATAARAGARVLVLEARAAVGGRARSDAPEGFTVNHGAHALYRAGSGAAVLGDLGVRYRGAIPRVRRAGWWADGRRVPAHRLSAAGGLDGLRAVRRLLVAAPRRDAARGETMGEWLDHNVPDAGRPLAETALRTACYVADMPSLDAGAALDQLATAAKGVLYLHGGWQTLVDGLRAAAVNRGAELVTARVERVHEVPGRVVVELRDGRTVDAGAVVLAAGGPQHADALVGGASAVLSGLAAASDPVLAACLDVAVAGSPNRRAVGTYGLAEPVYAVDHAATADLAPGRGAVHHALYYEPDRQPDVDHRAVLEALLDAQDPGWRERAVSVTFRRRSVVAHDRIRPGSDGTSRPTVAVPDVERVLVAGDWLTGHGMLADAPLSSGAEAGRAAVAVARGRSADRRVEGVGTR